MGGWMDGWMDGGREGGGRVGRWIGGYKCGTGGCILMDYDVVNDVMIQLMIQ